MKVNNWESVVPKQLTIRRVVGALSLITGIWAIFFQMAANGNIGMGELFEMILLRPFEFVESLLENGFWFWVVVFPISAGSKVQMIFDTKRFQLNWWAAAIWWLFILTNGFGVYSTTIQEAFEPVETALATIPGTGFYAMYLVFPLWLLIDVLDGLFGISKREQIQSEGGRYETG